MQPTWRRPSGASRRFAAPAAVLVAALALLPWPARAADSLLVNASAGPAAAFARYTAGRRQSTPWNLETIQIEACLPKLAKAGRFRAIRRLLPFGQPQYQVLELAGDQTVKQEVIVRYLSAEARAAEIPAASVAVTPANYKFRYKGVVAGPHGSAYVFLITPRKKRQGLIKGELWLDSETGAAVRQSGFLVKRPSIFVRRIDVTRETSFSGGVAESRITHVSVDLRLVGRAELTIEERPLPTTSRAVLPAR